MSDHRPTSPHEATPSPEHALRLATGASGPHQKKASDLSGPGLQALIARVLLRLARASSEQVDGAINGGLRDMGEYFGFDQAAVFLMVNEGQSLAEDTAWQATSLHLHAGLPLALNVEELPWLMQEVRAGRVVQVRRVASLTPEAGAERMLLQQCSVRCLHGCSHVLPGNTHRNNRPLFLA